MLILRPPLTFGIRFVLGWLLLLPGARTVFAAEPAVAPPLYSLIVGGGPDVDSNAAQIEGHVHFVAATLPAAARRAVLFTDGKADHDTVSYADLSAPADAKRAAAFLLGDTNAPEPLLTRKPNLGLPIDGPARFQDFRRALAKLSAQAARAPAPLLLYFAGHGTQDEKNEADTDYDLWDGDTLKVHALAAEIARVPRQVPVVLVMAQCFSGAFANLLFRGGDPKGALVEQNFAGFFSARQDREASGCSYQTSQEDYQDFSSYFFGALCGRDRFGNAVNGADYDGDGTVSLHEAFCYALIHDPSADTPVCTSEALLKRIAPLPDSAVYSVPYKEVWQAGTAAQRAVLDALSQQLGLTGEARALTVFDRLAYSDPLPRSSLLKAQNEAREKLNATRQNALGPIFGNWPALRWGDHSDEYEKAREGATEEIERDKVLCHSLIAAEKTHEQADGAVDNEEAVLQRFTSVYEHIVEAHTLREHGRPEPKAQFERLWKAEQNTLPLATR